MADIEIELKLEITKKIYEYFRSLIINNRTTYIQENIFFDTETRYLSAMSWAFRIRFQNEECILTVKGPAQKNNGVFERPEYELNIPCSTGKKMLNGFFLKDYKFIPCKQLNQLVGNLYLSNFISFVNERSYIDWKNWIIEIDKTSYKKLTFYELEIETNREDIYLVEIEIKKFFSIKGWEYIPSKYGKLARCLKYK